MRAAARTVSHDSSERPRASSIRYSRQSSRAIGSTANRCQSSCFRASLIRSKFRSNCATSSRAASRTSAPSLRRSWSQEFNPAANAPTRTPTKPKIAWVTGAIVASPGVRPPSPPGVRAAVARCAHADLGALIEKQNRASRFGGGLRSPGLTRPRPHRHRDANRVLRRDVPGHAPNSRSRMSPPSVIRIFRTSLFR